VWFEGGIRLMVDLISDINVVGLIEYQWIIDGRDSHISG
jgi:hypothetical protein